jgi:hypothetical protein
VLRVLAIALCLSACTVGNQVGNQVGNSSGNWNPFGNPDDGGYQGTDATSDDSGGQSSTADGGTDVSVGDDSVDAGTDVSVGDGSAAGESGGGDDVSVGGDTGSDDSDVDSGVLDSGVESSVEAGEEAGDDAGDDASSDAGSVDNDGGILECAPVNDNPGALTPGPALTASEVAETTAAIDDIVQANQSVADPQAFSTAVLSALAGVPHVADFGVAGDCSIWIRFTDGTNSFIVSDRAGFGPSDPDPLADPPDASAAPGPSPARLPRATRGTSGNTVHVPAATGALAFPGSGKAYIGYSDNLAPTALPRVKAALENRGYAVTSTTSLSIASLSTDVAGAGVLWLSTHGASSYDLYGRPTYAITTDDPLDRRSGACLGAPDDCRFIENQLTAGGVTRGWVEAGNSMKLVYAVGAPFLPKFALAPNSLVFIDACSSLQGELQTQDFQKALFGKNQGTLLGWQNVVNAGFAEQTAMFFFDRMLGGKSHYAPLGRYRPLSPPQRPFSAGDVYASMAQNGLIKDPKSSALFLMVPNPAADAVLVPSIRNLEVGNFAQKEAEQAVSTNLYLYGEFGDATGTLEIAGAPVTPSEWTSGRITAVLNPTTMGTVQAKVTLGGQTISGNIVPLTRWSGSFRARWTMSASIGKPGPFTELNCSNMHLRADIHLFRMAPEGVALAGTATDSQPFQQRIDFGSTTSDSVCGGSTGGSGVQGSGSTAQTQSFTDTGAQYAMLPWLQQPVAPPAAPAWWLAVRGSIDTSTYRLTMLTSGFVYTTLTITPANGDPPTVKPNTLYAMGPGVYNMPDIPLTLPAAVMGAYNATVTDPVTFPVLPGGLNDDGEIQYDLKVESGSAPDADTEG